MAIEEIETKIKKEIGALTYLFLQDQELACLNLLVCSQLLIRRIKGTVSEIFPTTRYREYSFIVAPAAKAYEGFLLTIAVYKRAITKEEIDAGSQKAKIGHLYHDSGKNLAPMKSRLLKGINRNKVDRLYNDWDLYRNSVLHFNKDFFVNSLSDAEEIVLEIHKSIKLGYKIFIGEPELRLPLARPFLKVKPTPKIRIKPLEKRLVRLKVPVDREKQRRAAIARALLGKTKKGGE